MSNGRRYSGNQSKYNRIIFSFKRKKGELMDPKLVRQFIIFLVILFGWTIAVLIAGPK
jgi:hypothetical protein